MNNLPPGVNEGMIPGNRQEDMDWDIFLEWAYDQFEESDLSVEDCRAAVKAGIEMVQKAIELQNIPEVVPDEQAIEPDPEEEESFVVPLSVTLNLWGSQMDDFKGNWREEIGAPETVGDLRRMIRTYGNSVRLAVRNAPLPKLYSLGVDGHPYLEIEIPDIPKKEREQDGKGGGK